MNPDPSLSPEQRIFVAGHRGMVGSAILRQLQKRGFQHLITHNRQQLDLLNPIAVTECFAQEKPDWVVLAAARVGGIQANHQYPAEFIQQNLLIQANVIHAAWQQGVQRLLFLGSSCIYPRLAEQPITEDALLTGKLEPTNEPYAIAKIAGIKLCESYNRQYGTQYRSVMPTNLYGPNDNFDLATSHVLPALIRRFHEAQQRGDSSVTLWGSGTPRREFLHVDDLADACLFVMGLSDADYASITTPMASHLNVGVGEDVSIRELAELIRQVVGFSGEIRWDTSKPDGTPRKLLDVSRLKQLGWQAQTPLQAGITATYRWYQQST